MPFEIIRGDITTLAVDGIVNAANPSLLGGGGVDGAIHKGAGPGLLEECKSLSGCLVGQAKVTKAYNLPSKYVIHTVGPIWEGGEKGEEALLRSCYKNALELAVELQLQSVAFPLIASGVYAYPKEQALKVAISEISTFISQHEMMIYMVVYDMKAYMLSEKLFSSVKAYIDDYYVEEQGETESRSNEFRSEASRSNQLRSEVSRSDQLRSKESRSNELRSEASKSKASKSKESRIEPSRSNLSEEAKVYSDKLFDCEPSMAAYAPVAKRRLDNVLNELQETFSEHLLRLISLKGKTDVETYKQANIDRKLFSKIRSDKFYKPSKSTAIAFAIALELSLDETKDLLQKAGFALSRSSKFDLIIEYFISEGNYNIYEINEALFDFEQALLGV